MWTFVINSVEPSVNSFVVAFTLLCNGSKYRGDSITIMTSWLANVPSDERAKYIQQRVDARCRELTAVEDVKTDFSSIVGQTFNVTPNTYKTKEGWDAVVVGTVKDFTPYDY